MSGPAIRTTEPALGESAAALLRGSGIGDVEIAASALRAHTTPHRAEFLNRALRAKGFDAELDPTSPGLLRLRLAGAPDSLAGVLAQALEPDLLCLDVDGTLIDTTPSFDAVVKRLTSAYTGETPASRELWAVRNEGGFNDDIELACELIRRRGVAAPSAEISAAFQRLYFGDQEQAGLWREERPILRPEVLARLRARLPLALVTGRNREECALAYRTLGLPSDLPSATIDDVVRGKPDPEGVLRMAARAKARRPWMVGDNVDDIAAGLRAGAIALGVGSKNREALVKAGAAVVLDDINRIEELL